MSKKCTSCGAEKPLTAFALNKARADGRHNMCRSCKKIYNAAYYLRTRDRHNPARVDCGETDIIVLQFDHRGDKVAGIANMITAQKPWEAVLSEIAKCDVVCANDHQRRTAATFGWHKLQVIRR